MVAPHIVIDSVELGHATDLQRVRADAVDPRAHLDQDHRELLDVRLARRVADDGAAGHEHRAEQRILGRGDRCLVQQHVGAGELRRLKAEAGAVVGQLRAESLQRQPMRIRPAAADDIAAGRTERDLLEALLGRGVRVDVGMQLAGPRAEGLLDRVLVGDVQPQPARTVRGPFRVEVGRVYVGTLVAKLAGHLKADARARLR